MSRLRMRWPQRRCRKCRQVFKPARGDQVFCNRQCKRAWHAWREGKGAQAVELLIKWRGRRLPGGFTALTAFADDLLHEHREREARLIEDPAEAQA